MKEKCNRLIAIIKQHPFTAILIVIAAILHLLIILPSGSHYCFNGYCGDFFWGVHEHDGIWHIAVAESAFKTFPPRNPIFEGSILSGYNSLLDFVLFLVGRLGIPSIITYFKILPIIWFIGFTYISLKLSNKWSKNPFFSFIFIFLNYFGASFSFFIPLIKNGTITGSASLLSMQAILTLTNVQLAYSYIFLLWIILILLDKKATKKNIALLCLFLFIQWGLKFYAGFISTIIVGVFFLLLWIKERKFLHILILFFITVSSIVSIVLNYNPFGQLSNGGLPFKFDPLALIWPLIEDPSMFYSYYWSNAKYTLLSSPNVSPRLIGLMIVLVLIYVFLNLGPRIVGLLFLIKKGVLKKMTEIDLGIMIGILFSLAFPIFFIQRGIWWNTVQFWFPIFLLLNIYTAEYIARIKSKYLLLFTTILIVGLSIPYSIDVLKSYYTYPGVINVSDSEKKALNFLKELPDGVVYSPLYKPKGILNKNGFIPLFNHVDSSYISAYTGKQSFYTNYVQLDLLNVSYKERKAQIEQGNCKILKNISYVYFHISQLNDLFVSRCVFMSKSFSQTYSSEGFTIYSKIK